MTKFLRTVFLFGIVLLLAVPSAHAQLSGSGIPGFFGIKSGSQAPPGAYVSYIFLDYDTTKIIGQDGREFSFQQGQIGFDGHAPGLIAVTNQKIFGANYGVLAYIPITNLAIEAPRAGLTRSSTFGASDLYVQPINLGWHKKQTDIIAWYGLYAPTGRYNPGANDNRGMGMWSHELALGSTYFFNEKRSFHASALGTLEFHSKKKDSDVQVGNILMIQGGVGPTLMQILDVGMTYYAQWKLSDDSGLGLPALVDGRLGKNHNYGLGPEIALVLPLKKDLSQLAIFNFRYIWDVGTRLDTQGNTLLFSMTFKLM